MSVWKNIKGVLSDTLQINLSGPKLIKSDSATLQLRDSAGSTATLDVNKVTGLAAPTANGDACNKNYVDSVGIPKSSCRLTTTTNHGLSGLADIDGVTPSGGDRILVQGQDNPEDNGIYDADSSSWTRSSDADGTPEGEVACGMYVFIEEGDTYGGSAFILITENPISIGTTELEFTSFGGGGGSAYVAKSTFDANTILKADSDDTPVALPVAASTFVGRKSSGSITDMSTTEARTELNVADGADVTATAITSINVNAHSDITSSGANIEDAVTKRHSQGTDTTLGTLSANVNFNGKQGLDFVAHNVADQTALDALTGVLGKIAFKVDTLDLWVCTSV